MAFEDFLVESASDDLAKKLTEKAASATGEVAKSFSRQLFDKGITQLVGSAAGDIGKSLVERYTRPSLWQQTFGSHGMVPKALLLGGAAAGLGAGASAIDKLHARSVRSPQKLHENIANMMSEFPEMRSADRKDVVDSMRTLQTFNPAGAADPLVAKSWVNKYLAFKDEGVHPSDVKLLSDVGKLHGELENKLDRSALVSAFSDVAKFAD